MKGFVERRFQLQIAHCKLATWAKGGLVLGHEVRREEHGMAQLIFNSQSAICNLQLRVPPHSENRLRIQSVFLRKERMW